MSAPPIPDEQAALLRAIVAEPYEDTPRLAYADWLQEHGDEEQAHYIRDAISLDYLEDYEDDRREKIGRRIANAERRNGLRWLAAVGVTQADIVYDRGLVASVVYDGGAAFLAEAPNLFAFVPVRDVTIHRITADDLEPDWLGVLADLPHLARLLALRISNDGWLHTPGNWEKFITSPHLANLRELSVQGIRLTDADAHLFNRCEHLGQLELLDLTGNELTAAGVLTVVRSPRMPNLTCIRFAYNNIIEDRRRGSLYLQLRDALIERFNQTWDL